MISKCKYLIVSLVFPFLLFGVGISFYLRLFMIIAYLYLSVFFVRNPQKVNQSTPQPLPVLSHVVLFVNTFLYLDFQILFSKGYNSEKGYK